MSLWRSITLTVDGSRKMLNVGKKVNPNETFGDLAHRLTDNEHIANENVSIQVKITFVSVFLI